MGLRLVDRVGANAMKHLTAEYTWEKAAAMVAVVYEDILGCGQTESREAKTKPAEVLWGEPRWM